MKSIHFYLETLKVRNILILSLATFLYSLTFYTTIFTLFLVERGLNYVEIFLLESILSASIVLFEVPSGVLADRFGRKKVIIASICLFTLSTFIIAFSHSFLWFVVESVLYGIGIAAMSGADSAMIYESLQKKQKKALADYSFSSLSTAATMAMVISLPLGGWMAEYSLDLPVYITCMSLTAATAVSFFLKETYINETKKSETKRIIHSLGTIIKKSPFLFLFQAIQSMASGFVFSLVYLNQPLFLSYDIEMQAFGWIMLVIHLLSSGVVLMAPMVRRKYGLTFIFSFTFFAPGISLFLLSFQPSMIMGITLLTLAITIHGVNDPIYRTFLNELVSDQNRATSLSIINLTGSIVGMCIKPLIGFFTEIDLYPAFTLMGSIMMTLAILIPFMLKKIKSLQI
ncbi:predicted MFS family arabinose efflux permease [Bacillus oleivorans]|uniref:Predicted MFS family arabinose efflux permease n=1 Tax=Bacillus oleivorans TaxID=1448271 RepID=A0A285D2M4_9BACI|nr:MFS transporter [Bacillus oleivorans]SNX74070.1 predicted MFS family arabinose efflux permease [Bacillus oleivorans]